MSKLEKIIDFGLDARGKVKAVGSENRYDPNELMCVIIPIKKDEKSEFKFRAVYSSGTSSLRKFLIEEGLSSGVLGTYIGAGYDFRRIFSKLTTNSANLWFFSKELVDSLSLIYQGSGTWALPSKARKYNRKDKPPIKKIGLGLTERTFAKYGSSASNAELIDLGIKSNSFTSTFGMNYTFGVEIETCSGEVCIADLVLNKMNMEITHDGSIQGGEFVTGVLQGDAGLVHLHKCIRVIKDSCKVDKTCGIHVHIGGADFNDEFSVFAYILGEKVQEDIFKMIPSSRRGNEYCQDLKPMNFEADLKEYGRDYGVQVAYNRLFEAMSNGRKLGENYNKKKQHPDGRWAGRYNGGVEQKDLFRYMWLNFIPFNFNVRGVKHPEHGYDQSGCTIEVRNHSGTLNFIKTKMWVLICMSMVYYIENHKEDILSKKSITIADLVSAALGRRAGNVLKYIERRKSHFQVNKEEDKEVEPELRTRKEVCA